jgi:hypothetical protein
MNAHSFSSDITRREAIRRGLIGATGLALSDQVIAAAPAARRDPKAKAVIQIWLWGGPSHLETFDPKPEAGSDYCGDLNSPVETNVSGVRICELLPKLAKHADKYALIRSMTHGVQAHETAAYITQTGRHPDRNVYPSMGAVVSKFKGYEQGYKGLIPPYVVLTRAQGRFSESGFLGPMHKPFVTGGDPNSGRFVVEGVVAQGISDQRQRSRRKLLHDLDTLGRALPSDPNFDLLNRCEEKAYDMILGDAGKIFDLNTEKDEKREEYGRNTFGQSCLMAKRLVESGVPFVTINYNGWDTHKQHFQIMQRKLAELDAGVSTLLADLAASGLLDSTIVWCSGEFGRTPKIQWNPPWNGGRGHFGHCFSAMVAGGGFRGGQVIGASNKTGMEVAERPVHPRDLIGTVYSQLGIDPDGKLPNPRNLDYKVMPTSQEGAPEGGGRLKELV